MVHLLFYILVAYTNIIFKNNAGFLKGLSTFPTKYEDYSCRYEYDVRMTPWLHTIYKAENPRKRGFSFSVSCIINKYIAGFSYCSAFVIFTP
jgi:hypothetical protein